MILFTTSVHSHVVISHSLCVSFDVIAIKLPCQVDIEISAIFGIWFACDLSFNFLALINSDCAFNVEHCLFPVSVLCVRAGAETDGFVAGSELNVKPRNQSVHEIVATYSEGVWAFKVQVGGLHSV